MPWIQSLLVVRVGDEEKTAMQKKKGYTREDMMIDKNQVQSGDFVD